MRRRDDSGAIAIVVALFSVVLFGFAALVVDVGHLADVRSQNQRAADAAAIAGVRSLAKSNGTMAPDTLADLVKQYAHSNAGVDAGDWGNCSDPAALLHPADAADPTDTCISYAMPSDAGGSAWQVRVKLPDRHVPASFAGVFGVGSVTVAPVAIAQAGQPPPSPCVPCDPRLDETTQQPVSSPSTPSGVTLPDPATVAPAPPVDPLSNCPTGPGRFDSDVTIIGACELNPGLYLFNDHTLDIKAAVTSLPGANGVTLAFYGTAQDTLDVGASFVIAATPSGQAPLAGEIPGVAVIIAQYDQSVTNSRSFELGASFAITGSVYAIGDTTWATAVNDCRNGATCRLDDGVLAVAKTSFASGVPNVESNTPVAPPPAEPAHLSE